MSQSCQEASPLIHVGFPKTGSTWLQANLFNDSEIGFHRVPPLDVLEYFVFRDIGEFDGRATESALSPEIAEAERKRLVPVLSHEVLVGDPTQGKYWGAMTADRICDVFPLARILIIIREQASMLVSTYKQHVSVGGTVAFDKFTARQHGFSAYCRLEYFEYDSVISQYQGLFGKENVLVLPFEMMKLDLQDFGNRILRFAGLAGDAPVSVRVKNRGSGAASVALRRFLNRFVEPWNYFGGPTAPKGWRKVDRASRLVQRWIPKAVHMRHEELLSQTAKELVRGRYSISNRRTGDLIGFDLSTFGYEV